MLFTVGTYKYRIKPEEPKFKVGDWVVDKVGNINKIIDMNSDYLKFKGGVRDNSIFNYELWQPESGDLVIPEADIDIVSFVVTIWKDGDEYACEPFIGKAPSNF